MRLTTLMLQMQISNRNTEEMGMKLPERNWENFLLSSVILIFCVLLIGGGTFFCINGTTHLPILI